MKRVQRTVLVTGVSMQEQAVLTALPNFERVEVQDFHLDDCVFPLFLLFGVAVVVVTVVVVLN